MTFNPTAEQQAISAFVRDEASNLLIVARAGTGKTTTLQLVANELPKTSVLYLAFNKKIADEAQEKLPDHCVSRTLNSLGHRAWAQQTGKRLFVNRTKMLDLVKHHMASDFSRDEREILNENFSDLLRVCGFAKQCGYVPDHLEFKTARRLCGDEEFFGDRCYLNLEPEERRLITLCIASSIESAMQGDIDYDDQIFMPTVFPATFDRYKVIMVDEAQDLSLINHAMLKKVVRKSRLIAVGDPCQAIYGFRGAHEDSMDVLQETFFMHRMYLTTSFRCPVAVISEARTRAPDMKPMEGAKQGTVINYATWDFSQITDNCVVICRNNAPLFKLALMMIKAGRSPELIGRDVLKNLKNKMKRLGKTAIRQKQLLVEIQSWYQKELERNRDGEGPGDMRDAMLVFAEDAETLGDALESIDKLIRSPGRIKLMSGHKAKGLEFPSVFFLDEHLCQWQRGQDFNIWYVIVTRSMKDLAYITTSAYVEQ